MKNARIIGLGIIAVVAAVMLAGCSSTSIITEYDAQGNITKKTETKESVVEQVMASTQNKTVIAFREAYVIGLQLSPADTTTETIMSFLCMYAHKNTGVISVLKDQENLDKIAQIVLNLKNTDSVSASTSGVSSSSSSATTNTTEAKQ